MWIKGLMAGILIGIAALGNVAAISAGSTIFGAVLFCIGLLTILIQGFKLVTGNVGNVLHHTVSWLDMLTMLFWNAIGVILIAMLRRIDVNFDMLMPTL